MNTVLVTDSLVKQSELYFPSQASVFCEILDSAGTEILSSDIKILRSKTQKLDLQFISEEWLLLPEAEFELSPVFLNTINSDSLKSDQNITSTTKHIIIRSEYTSSNNPNKKEIGQLDALIFEKDKISAVKNLISSNNLSKTELLKVLNIISFEDKRLEIITENSTFVKGVFTRSDMDHLFKLDRYKMRALESLGL